MINGSSSWSSDDEENNDDHYVRYLEGGQAQIGKYQKSKDKNGIVDDVHHI